MNVADAIAVLGFLFKDAEAPPCVSAADTNDDGVVNIADAIALLAYLFVRGTEPFPEPFAVCGTDPTPDPISCTTSTYGCAPF